MSKMQPTNQEKLTVLVGDGWEIKRTSRLMNFVISFVAGVSASCAVIYLPELTNISFETQKVFSDQAIPLVCSSEAS